MKHVKVPPSNCPVCGARQDAATNLTQQEGPKPGDLTVCLYCQTVCRFAGEEMQLVVVGQEELEKLDPEFSAYLGGVISKCKEVMDQRR